MRGSEAEKRSTPSKGVKIAREQPAAVGRQNEQGSAAGRLLK
jgi:hypothetical protein